MGVVIFGILTPRPTHSTIKYQQNIEPYVVAITPAEIPKPKVLTGRYVNGNCVLFARSVRPDLPKGLYTKTAKQKLIRKQKPEIGDVAVTNESYAGHLAIVIKVEDLILIKESGNGRGITTRWVERNQIEGYF